MGKTTQKDTFWNQKKQEFGVTLKQLSRDLDIDQALLSHFFTGRNLPSTDWSIKICDYFGVDYITGAEAFNAAHECWVAEHPGKSKQRFPYP